MIASVSLTCSLFAVPALSEPHAACVTYTAEVAAPKFPSLNLPFEGWDFDSNSYGVGGRRTSLQKCLLDSGDGTFGWNWTRGLTEPTCATTCKAPDCYADFSFAAATYGVSPWGGSSGAKNMPVNVDELRALHVSQNISWAWSDDAPGVEPPETSSRSPTDARRVRFIYDLWLTREKPVAGRSVASSITDEVIIDLSSNPGFPGSQPPGCLHWGDRFSNVTWGPVKVDAVFDGHHWYDYYWTDHNDLVPGMGTRYSSFRRKGADAPGSGIPEKVNVKPFVEGIREMWPGEPVGPWLGHVSISTELYDHSSGQVTFWSPPTIEPVYASVMV